MPDDQRKHLVTMTQTPSAEETPVDVLRSHVTKINTMYLSW